MTSQSRYIRSCDGTRLHASCHGDAQLPALVLVHGYPDNAQVWTPLIAELLPYFYIVTYDVRGAGRSDTPGRHHAQPPGIRPCARSTYSGDAGHQTPVRPMTGEGGAS